jgi:GntR family transcriptional repressor for pyruvate dehydrogenase complex
LLSPDGVFMLMGVVIPTSGGVPIRTPASEQINLGVIRVTKTYEALADHLREQILGGAIPPGASLPNERDLGERTGLSRGSVREALRVLETQGLVSTRQGRNGGRIVQQTGVDDIAESLGFFVRGQRIEFVALLETAETLEPALAALAARHRTADDIAELTRITAELKNADDDVARFLAANDSWHLAIAKASHNPLLAAIMQSIGALLHDPHVEDFTSPAVRAAVLRAHASIQKAIVGGDPDAARRRMERHVKAYRAEVVPVAPETITLPRNAL